MVHHKMMRILQKQTMLEQFEDEDDANLCFVNVTIFVYYLGLFISQLYTQSLNNDLLRTNITKELD